MYKLPFYRHIFDEIDQFMAKQVYKYYVTFFEEIEKKIVWDLAMRRSWTRINTHTHIQCTNSLWNNGQICLLWNNMYFVFSNDVWIELEFALNKEYICYYYCSWVYQPTQYSLDHVDSTWELFAFVYFHKKCNDYSISVVSLTSQKGQRWQFSKRLAQVDGIKKKTLTLNIEHTWTIEAPICHSKYPPPGLNLWVSTENI